MEWWQKSPRSNLNADPFEKLLSLETAVENWRVRVDLNGQRYLKNRAWPWNTKVRASESAAGRIFNAFGGRRCNKSFEKTNAFDILTRVGAPASWPRAWAVPCQAEAVTLSDIEGEMGTCRAFDRVSAVRSGLDSDGNDIRCSNLFFFLQ
jgi:hypothetical protein